VVTQEKSNSIAFTFDYSESSKEWLWPQSISKEDIADVITRWVNINLLSKAINKFLKAIFFKKKKKKLVLIESVCYQQVGESNPISSENK
jgi:hypothetical protein